VVVSIPLRAYRTIPAAPLAGKPVIDTCNYYPQRTADCRAGQQAADQQRLIQRQAAAAHVVKAFNNIYCRHLLALSRPSGAADRTFLTIAATTPARRLR